MIQDKVIIITGASSSSGEATAKLMAKKLAKDIFGRVDAISSVPA